MYARLERLYLDDLSDSELVLRFRGGDDDALEVLLRRHSEDLYRFCQHLTGNREDAEDIYQESMARAIDRVDSLQSGSAFRGWLFRIARNLSVDAFRTRRRTCPLPDGDVTPEPLHVESPHERVEIGEDRQTVVRALNRLADRHRQVLMLREVEGLSYADIARSLDVSQAAVETLLFRARRRLREEYAKGDRRRVLPAVMIGLRSVGAQLTAPLAGGSSVASKVAITALVVGSAAHATPQFLAPHHVRMGAPRPVLKDASPRARHQRAAHRLATRVPESRNTTPIHQPDSVGTTGAVGPSRFTPITSGNLVLLRPARSVDVAINGARYRAHSASRHNRAHTVSRTPIAQRPRTGSAHYRPVIRVPAGSRVLPLATQASPPQANRRSVQVFSVTSATQRISRLVSQMSAPRIAIHRLPAFRTLSPARIVSQAPVAASARALPMPSTSISTSSLQAHYTSQPAHPDTIRSSTSPSPRSVVGVPPAGTRQRHQ